jgi:hypothetical protein
MMIPKTMAMMAAMRPLIPIPKKFMACLLNKFWRLAYTSARYLSIWLWLWEAPQYEITAFSVHAWGKVLA